MNELAIVIAGLLANVVTTMIKPGGEMKPLLSQEELDARKTLVRGINLVAGLVTVLASSWLLGEPLDVTSVESSVGALATIIVTFLFSQGTYFLTKK